MNFKVAQTKKPNPDIINGIHYPSSDGKPLAETPIHLDVITTIKDILQKWLPQADVCIAADMFVYYEEGNPRRHVTPDVMFVRGAPRNEAVGRLAYRTWLEPRQTLDWVLEVTSASTHREDRVTKRRIYQDRLGVQEYFLFDPLMAWLNPPLQGWRLHNGVYQPIEWVESRLPSEVLSLHLEHDGQLLRLYNPVTQQWLLSSEEREERLAENLHESEQTRKRDAEARKRAEESQKRAEEESKRLREADQAREQELERLREEIERLRQQRPDAT